MSRAALDYAWSVSGLSASERIVLVCLADHHNERNGLCYPAISRIARQTSLHRSAVIRILKRLDQQYALVEIAQGGGRNANRYRFRELSTPVAESDGRGVAQGDRSGRFQTQRRRTRGRPGRPEHNDEQSLNASDVADSPNGSSPSLANGARAPDVVENDDGSVTIKMQRRFDPDARPPYIRR